MRGTHTNWNRALLCKYTVTKILGAVPSFLHVLMELKILKAIFHSQDTEVKHSCKNNIEPVDFQWRLKYHQMFVKC